jgi:hypothetical protein
MPGERFVVPHHEESGVSPPRAASETTSLASETTSPPSESSQKKEALEASLRYALTNSGLSGIAIWWFTLNW